MLKKIGIIGTEIIVLVSLAIIIAIGLTRGFYFTFGPLKIKANHITNPVFFLSISIGLRKVLTGKFLGDFVCFAYLGKVWTKNRVRLERLLLRIIATHGFTRQRLLLGLIGVGCLFMGG